MNPNEFRCKSRGCVAMDTLCDGFSDCDDSSDEELCGNLFVNVLIFCLRVSQFKFNFFPLQLFRFFLLTFKFEKKLLFRFNVHCINIFGWPFNCSINLHLSLSFLSISLSLSHSLPLSLLCLYLQFCWLFHLYFTVNITRPYLRN